MLAKGATDIYDFDAFRFVTFCEQESTASQNQRPDLNNNFSAVFFPVQQLL